MRRALADLKTTVDCARTPADQHAAVIAGLRRLRPMYARYQVSFTGDVLRQINELKRLLILTDTAVDSMDAVAVTVPLVENVPAFVTVGQAVRDVADAIRSTFPNPIWVRGEVSEYKRAASGHHYLTLVERIDGAETVLSGIVWRTAWDAVGPKMEMAGVEIAPGQDMLFRGRLGVYESGGKLQLYVSDVFPEFTLGRIEADRLSVLRRLTERGLVGLNLQLIFPDLPLRIALVGSRNSDGMRDFYQTLLRSPYRFDIMFAEAAVQGPNVEHSVCRTLDALGRGHREMGLDAVCIVRGGGSATELGCWNSFPICEAIARMPIPVVTGIGHERDRVAADEVAHSAAATPTAAAEVFCRAVAAAEARVYAATEVVARVGKAEIGRAQEKLARTRRVIADHAGGLIASLPGRFDAIVDQVAAHARRGLAAGSHDVSRATQCVGDTPIRAVKIAALRLDGIADAVRTSAMVGLRQAKITLHDCAEPLPRHADRALAAAGLRLKEHVRTLTTVPEQKTAQQAGWLHARAEVLHAVGTSRSAAAAGRHESVMAAIREIARRKLDRDSVHIEVLAARLLADSDDRLSAERVAIEHHLRFIRTTGPVAMDRARAYSDAVLSRLVRDADRTVRSAACDLGRLCENLAAVAGSGPGVAGRRLAAISLVVTAYDPAVLLRRGYSLTLTEDGHVIRAADQVRVGQLVVTRLGNGTIHSTVTSGENE